MASKTRKGWTSRLTFGVLKGTRVYLGTIVDPSANPALGLAPGSFVNRHTMLPHGIALSPTDRIISRGRIVAALNRQGWPGGKVSSFSLAQLKLSPSAFTLTLAEFDRLRVAGASVTADGTDVAAMTPREIKAMRKAIASFYEWPSADKA